MRPAVLARLVTAGLVLAVMSTTVSARLAWAKSPYQQVLRAYQHAGSVAPCQFSGAALAAALKGIDSYGTQYFADFTQAVDDALSARAAGACSVSGRQRRGVPSPPGSSGPGVGVPAHMLALTAPSGGAPPGPLLLLGALGLVAVCATGVTLVNRSRGR